MKSSFFSNLKLVNAFLVLFLGIGMFAPSSVCAQGVAPEAGLGIYFNTTDVVSDFCFGVNIQEIRTSVKASFQTRLGTKRVLVESDTPNLVYQFQERRYLFGIEADKRFMLTELNENVELGLYLGGFLGVTLTDYRGTKTEGSVGLGYEGMAGAYLSDPRYYILRLGYIYMPLQTQNITPHRIGISMSFVISDDF